jgi:hypothetical protein
MQNAYHVEQQAKQLYVMSSAELNAMGMSRERIPTHLAKII